MAARWSVTVSRHEHSTHRRAIPSLFELTSEIHRLSLLESNGTDVLDLEHDLLRWKPQQEVVPTFALGVFTSRPRTKRPVVSPEGREGPVE